MASEDPDRTQPGTTRPAKRKVRYAPEQSRRRDSHCCDSWLVVLACVLLTGWDDENRSKKDEQRYMQGDYYGMMRTADHDE